jgi:hypothetical protein
MLAYVRNAYYSKSVVFRKLCVLKNLWKGEPGGLTYVKIREILKELINKNWHFKIENSKTRLVKSLSVGRKRGRERKRELENSVLQFT